MCIDHRSFGAASQADSHMRGQRGSLSDSSAWIEEGRSRGCSKSSSKTILATSLQLYTETHSRTPGPYNRVGGWSALLDLGAHGFGPELFLGQ